MRVEENEEQMPPRQPRASMLLNAQCTDELGETYALRVQNLSDTGIGGQMNRAVPLEIGEQVTLALRDVRKIKGDVVWVDGNRVGIRFCRQFNTATLDIAAWWRGPSFEVAEMHRLPLED